MSGVVWAAVGLLVPALLRRHLPERIKRAPRT
jgi:hypothetical protein